MIAKIMKYLLSIFSTGVGENELGFFSRSRGRIFEIDRRIFFDPVSFFGSGHEVWEIVEQDDRSLLVTSVDLDKIVLTTCIMISDRGKISGEEKLKRMKDKGKIRLDLGIFLALYNEIGHGALEYLFKHRGVEYLDFMGTVLRAPNNRRYILYLYRHKDVSWHWSFKWLGDEFHSRHFSASLALPCAVSRNLLVTSDKKSL